jgi:hypothetical protein
MRLAKTNWVMLTLSHAQNLLQSHEEEASIGGHLDESDKQGCSAIYLHVRWDDE